MVDVSNLQNLGFTAKVASQIDQLDGNQDGKINKNVFDLAKAIVEKNTEQVENLKNQVSSEIFSKLKNFANKITDNIKEKGDKYNNKDESTNTNYEITKFSVIDKKAPGGKADIQQETYAGEVLKKVIPQVIDYYKKHNTLEGFEVTGLSDEIEDISFSIMEDFSDPSNDKTVFEKDTNFPDKNWYNSVKIKVADGIIITCHFKVVTKEQNGQESKADAVIVAEADND